MMGAPGAEASAAFAMRLRNTCSISSGSIGMRRKRFGVVANHLGVGPLDGAVDDLGYIRHFPFGLKRSREIEKPRDEGVGAVDFRADDFGEFFRERGIVAGGRSGEKIRRSFDAAQRVAQLMREAGGELSESGEAIGAAHRGFGGDQTSVGLGELFGGGFVSRGLSANGLRPANSPEPRPRRQADSEWRGSAGSRDRCATAPQPS